MIRFAAAMLMLISCVACSSVFGELPQRKEVYVRNASDRPVRVFFVNSNVEQSFCVLRVKESSTALVRTVPTGYWQVAAFELVGLHAMDAAGMRLTPEVAGSTVNITGRNGNYEVSVEEINP